jgi:signal transduction histidine kinase
VVEGKIRVHVDDDGIGIPPDEREKVFFAPSPASTARATVPPAATASGLAIASLVLEQQHGGRRERRVSRRSAAPVSPLPVAIVTKRH